mgnify:CR=1 FL=1
MFGVVQSILYVVVAEEFFSAFVEKRENKRWIVWVTWISLFFYRMFVMVYTQNILQNILGNLLGILIVLYLLYVHKWQTFVLAPIWFFSLSGAVENAFGLGIIWLCGSIDPSVRLYGVVSNIIFWFVIKILELTVKKPLADNGRKSESLILACIALLTIFAVVLFFEMNNRIDNFILHGTTFILMAALLIVDILAFKIYGFLYDRRVMKIKNDQYAYQLKLCNKEMEERNITMDEIRRARHDMKNHMIYLQKLVEKDPEKAQAYISDFLANCSTKEVSQTGNLVVDALVNYKYLLATQKHIEMNVDISIPKELNYDTADICIILGNLLDNAIEAAKKCEKEKKVSLKMKCVNSNMSILIENTYSGEIYMTKEGIYKTSKKDTERHGIGLQSVQKSIEKYKGILTIDISTEGYFMARVLM